MKRVAAPRPSPQDDRSPSEWSQAVSIHLQMNSAVFHQRIPPSLTTSSSLLLALFFCLLFFFFCCPWPPLSRPLSPFLFHFFDPLCPHHEICDQSLYVKYIRHHLVCDQMHGNATCRYVFVATFPFELSPTSPTDVWSVIMSPHESENTAHAWERLASS